jgi:autotransporter passenger strand-loop-strand repeat protein
MGAGSDVTIYNGGSCNVNGGRATLTEVSSGGSFTVQNCSDSETGSAYQGVADLTTVRSGGVMRLVSGGSAGHTTVGNGGLLELLSGGTATNVVATAGANLKFDFSPDTYIQGTMDGYDFELKDGILPSFLVKSQTLEVSSGGSFVGGTIGDSGSVVISSGAAAENTFVGSNGSIFIEGGGAAIGTIIQTGGSIGIHLEENTHVEGTSGGRSFNGKDGIMSGLALGNGFLEVGSGCLAISTTVSGEGQVRVQKGGLASATTVGSGGSLTVLSGGKAQRVTIGENGHLTVSHRSEEGRGGKGC